jgi:hypothetical protein
VNYFTTHALTNIHPLAVGKGLLKGVKEIMFGIAAVRVN